MSQVRSKQVRLRKCEGQVTRSDKRIVDAALSHGLSLARAELALPAPAESGYPVAIFEVECANIGGITAIEFLLQLDADVVVHVVMDAVLRSRFEGGSAASLLPANFDALCGDGRREQAITHRQSESV